MGKDTKIEWCDHTFNSWHWSEPLKWDAAAKEAGERHRVFCASMADVFEDRDDLLPHRERLWNLIRETPNLDWLLLTKRPENISRMIPAFWNVFAPSNVWYGTTAGDQDGYDKRILHLLKVPACIRFLSCEPLLSGIDIGLGRLMYNDVTLAPRLSDHLQWVICGGESGAGAREMDLAWARSIRDQCKAAGVAFFMKQLGERIREGAWTMKQSSKTMGDIETFPPGLQVREFPNAVSA